MTLFISCGICKGVRSLGRVVTVTNLTPRKAIIVKFYFKFRKVTKGTLDMELISGDTAMSSVFFSGSSCSKREENSLRVTNVLVARHHLELSKILKK